MELVMCTVVLTKEEWQNRNRDMEWEYDCGEDISEFELPVKSLFEMSAQDNPEDFARECRRMLGRPCFGYHETHRYGEYDSSVWWVTFGYVVDYARFEHHDGFIVSLDSVSPVHVCQSDLDNVLACVEHVGSTCKKLLNAQHPVWPWNPDGAMP